MPFPAKFRHLIEAREDQVKVPDYVWLSFAVCAVEEDSCGWGGWMIESAWKAIENAESEVTADTDQRCPNCGKPLFRTEVEKQYVLNSKAGPKISFEYDTAPIQFTKTPEERK